MRTLPPVVEQVKQGNFPSSFQNVENKVKIKTQKQNIYQLLLYQWIDANERKRKAS